MLLRDRSSSTSSAPQPPEGGAVTQLETARIRQRDRRGTLQLGERARYRLDGQAKIIGDVLARHRQIDAVAGRRAPGHFEQEADHALLGGLDDGAQRGVLRLVLHPQLAGRVGVGGQGLRDLLDAADPVLETRRPRDGPRARQRLRIARVGLEADRIRAEADRDLGQLREIGGLMDPDRVEVELGEAKVDGDVTLVPFIGPSGELKTKPTQHSVAALRSIGIQPDAVVLRCDRAVPESIKRKISLMCDVDQEAIVAAVDAPSIYDIPKVLFSEGLDRYIVRRMSLPAKDVNWTRWDDLLRVVHHPKHELTVALVGKYIDLPDAYLSVTEALRAGAFANDAKIHIRWVGSDQCETAEGAAAALADVDAVCVPGGFGVRGIEGKLGALRYTRENRIPTLGLCLGLQCMVIEYARTIGGLHDANSKEFDENTPNPVIATMADQEDVVSGERDMGGTMRLGTYPAKLASGSVVAQAYGAELVEERHRHRYEVNNKYRPLLEEKGLRFSGTSPDGHLVEFVELPEEVHPYYVATQAHPEFKSRPTKAHPLFAGLVAAGLKRRAR